MQVEDFSNFDNNNILTWFLKHTNKILNDFVDLKYPQTGKNPSIMESSGPVMFLIILGKSKILIYIISF